MKVKFGDLKFKNGETIATCAQRCLAGGCNNCPMSELTKALLKHRRAQLNEGYQFDYERECAKAVVEEMADVYIVLLQMIQLFGEPSLFEEYVRNKILRLRLRLFADGTEAAENGE